MPIWYFVELGNNFTFTFYLTINLEGLSEATKKTGHDCLFGWKFERRDSQLRNRSVVHSAVKSGFVIILSFEAI
jgi:hypothetical protein